MYAPEILADRVREIRDEVNKTSAHRVHRSVADRLRALKSRAGR